MKSDFDWRSPENKGDIVFPTCQGVAVYRNSFSEIVIRQKGVDGDDDSFVVIPAHHALTVMTAIRKEVEKGAK